MKKTLLFIILVLSLGVVKAQTWKVLGNNAEVSTSEVNWADMTIDHNTNAVYIVVPGYETTDSITFTNCLNLFKYNSSTWESLPSPQNLDLIIPNSYVPEDIKARVAYSNDALYLFYCFDNANNKVRIKKFKNNVWSEVGDSVNGYNLATNYFHDILVYNNSIYIYTSNVLYIIDSLDNINSVLLPYSEPTTGGMILELNGEIYILGKTEYGGVINESIHVFKYSPSNSTIETIVNTNILGLSFNDKVELVSINNKLYIIVVKNNTLPSSSSIISHYEITNNQLTLLSTHTIENVQIHSSRFKTANNRIVAIAYKSEIEQQVLIFNGTTWSLYGNFNQEYSPLKYSYQIVFDSNNKPYIIGESFFTQKAAVIYLENPVSISEPEVSSFSVFPNPSNGVFNIHTSENAENINYQIYALDGKKIVEKTNVSAPFSVDISNASNGVYILKVNQNGKSETFKLLKLNE